MKHVLAPVPAVHLASAHAVFAAQGVVAFGSNAFDVWSSVAEHEATVWIYASSTDKPAGGLPGLSIGKVVWSARFRGLVTADRRGRHPVPAHRPQSTLDDTEFHYGQFWEIDEVEILSPPMSLSSFATTKGAGLSRPPHGPMIVQDPRTRAP